MTLAWICKTHLQFALQKVFNLVLSDGSKKMLVSSALLVCNTTNYLRVCSPLACALLTTFKLLNYNQNFPPKQFVFEFGDDPLGKTCIIFFQRLNLRVQLNYLRKLNDTTKLMLITAYTSTRQ